MLWWQYALCGAGGGIIAEVLALYGWFTAWSRARRAASGLVRAHPPQLRKYVDVAAHVWVLFLRALIGAACAALFAAGGQLKGVYAAAALGFCAPELLSRLGEIPQVAAAVKGEEETAATSPDRRPLSPASQKRSRKVTR